MNNQQDNQNAVSFLQIITLVFSLYILVALALEWLFPLPEQSLLLLRLMDVLICGWFLADFVIQFRRAKSKLQYLKWGWIDLVSSIPFLPFLRWGRLVRVARILMILRSIRSVKALFQMIFQSRIRGTFLSVALVSIVMVMISSVAILVCETTPQSNIKTAGDALWWAFSTITSVGYGDLFPVTWEGRFIAAVLMTAGVAMFTTLTAYMVSLFGGFRSDDVRCDKMILEELQELHRKVDAVCGKKQPRDPAGDKKS